MTTKDQPRRPRRTSGEGSGSARGAVAPQRPFCERLKAAREARGVDLFRVERDTKIRVRFLAALEEGNYEELPADVYARGFLRNYASYLGLSPDEAEEDWRRRKSAPPAKPAAPKAAPVDRSAASTTSAVANGAAPATSATPVAAPMGRSAAAMAQSVARRLLALGRAQPAGESAEAPLGGPQPMTVPRRALLLQPIHVILLTLALIIVAVGLFFGMQITKLLQYPSVAVTSPNQAAITLATGTTQYELKGTATAGTVVNISWDGRDPKTVLADASGNWSYVTPLHSGINQFDIHSFNADTNHPSPVITRLINVPVPTASPTPQLLTVESPTDGQVIPDGNVTVKGSTVSVTSVTVTPTYVGPPPPVGASPTPLKTAPNPTAQATMMPPPTATPLATATATPLAGLSPSPSASPPPGTTTVIPTIDGKFAASLHLAAGIWKLSVVGTNGAGQSTTPVIVNVVVTIGGLTVVIDIKHGDALLKIWKDGVIVPGYPKLVQSSGKITIAAGESVWIWTSQMTHTFVTINGKSYGQLGTKGNAAGSWRLTATGPPTPSNDV